MDLILGHQRKDLLQNIEDCNSQYFIQEIKQLKDKRDELKLKIRSLDQNNNKLTDQIQLLRSTKKKAEILVLKRRKLRIAMKKYRKKYQ